MKGQHTQGQWRAWHTGFTAAPFVIYTGDAEPTLDEKGHLVMAPESIYIGEFSSQTMRLDERDNWIDEASANVRLVLAAQGMAEALKYLTEVLPVFHTLHPTDRDTAIRMAHEAIAGLK
jgi:hypothetical protein